MTHTAATPLLWWFQFIESDDLYWNFKALAAYHAGEDRRGQGLINGTISFPNPHYDLGAMSLQNQRMAYAWVYSKSATEQMPKTGPLFQNISIGVHGLLDGPYRVEIWDTHEGTITARLTLNTRNSLLTIPLPDFRLDCAVKVKRAQ
jgi:hypothetical protein